MYAALSSSFCFKRAHLCSWRAAASTTTSRRGDAQRGSVRARTIVRACPSSMWLSNRHRSLLTLCHSCRPQTSSPKASCAGSEQLARRRARGTGGGGALAGCSCRLLSVYNMMLSVRLPGSLVSTVASRSGPPSRCWLAPVALCSLVLSSRTRSVSLTSSLQHSSPPDQGAEYDGAAARRLGQVRARRLSIAPPFASR